MEIRRFPSYSGKNDVQIQREQRQIVSLRLILISGNIYIGTDGHSTSSYGWHHGHQEDKSRRKIPEEKNVTQRQP